MKFTKTHEWIEVEGKIGTIGISDFAQKELGDIVFVETPKVGDEIKAGTQMGTVESVKAVSELNAPASGKVVEVNKELETAPQLLNEDPFGKGWIIKIELSDPSELDSLMDENSYRGYIAEQSH
ncbi:MAG: glycine cleavage system protein GcvH [Acidobacteria bacterium]|nr:glycine cleavage system protein GcvH [Acidobacteriota bacterium]